MINLLCFPKVANFGRNELLRQCQVTALSSIILHYIQECCKACTAGVKRHFHLIKLKDRWINTGMVQNDGKFDQ